MARSQLWKHQGGLAGHAHFLIHLKTSPHYGLFEIRGQGPGSGSLCRVSDVWCVAGSEMPGIQARKERVEGEGAYKK